MCEYSVLIENLLLANYRLSRCNVLIVILMLVSYRLYRCSVVIEKLLLANYRLYRCSALIEILLLANYGLRRFRLVIVMLLLVDDSLYGCSVVKEILFLESFGLCRCNELTSECCHYNNLPFEVVEAWCTNNTRISSWVSVNETEFFFRLIEDFLTMYKYRCNEVTVLIRYWLKINKRCHNDYCQSDFSSTDYILADLKAPIWNLKSWVHL